VLTLPSSAKAWAAQKSIIIGCCLIWLINLPFIIRGVHRQTSISMPHLLNSTLVIMMVKSTIVATAHPSQISSLVDNTGTMFVLGTRPFLTAHLVYSGSEAFLLTVILFGARQGPGLQTGQSLIQTLRLNVSPLLVPVVSACL
jgi:hypothetical protein